MTVQELKILRSLVGQVFVHDSLYHYICKLTQETRQNTYIELGASPRGTVSLMRMAQAEAFLHERSYVIPEDVQEVFFDVIAHRILRSSKARAAKITEKQILQLILDQIKAPSPVRS